MKTLFLLSQNSIWGNLFSKSSLHHNQSIGIFFVLITMLQNTSQALSSAFTNCLIRPNFICKGGNIILFGETSV